MNEMNDDYWKLLLDRIDKGQCTPFLGAGINYGLLPLGGDIARDWAAEYEYPLKDHDDLPKIAQYLAVTFKDGLFPKMEILKRLHSMPAPDFSQPDKTLEGLKALAELTLSLYITTNYDDLMVKALLHSDKRPRREFCRWNNMLKEYPSVFDSEEDFTPSADNPLVYHIHGLDEVPESLVLTEDDFLDFLANVLRNQKLVPPSES